MTTTAPSLDLRPAAELVLEALEIVGARGQMDLRMQPRPLSDALDDLATRLAAPGALPLNGAAILAALVADPLRVIVQQPNHRLQRTRRKMPFQRVREQDARCMAWFARQPGRTVEEKLGRSQRLLGVVRELSQDVLENRVTRAVCERLTPRLQAYLEAHGHKQAAPRLTAVRQAQHWAKQWEIIAEEVGVRRLTELPHPNNVLLRDRSYHRVWLAAQWIALEDERLSRAAATIERGWTEVLALVVALAVRDCGWPLLDAGVQVHDHGERLAAELAAWTYMDSDWLVRIALRIVDETEIELSQKVWLSNGDADRKTLRIGHELDADKAAFTMRMRDGISENVRFTTDWTGVKAAKAFLVEKLSRWSGAASPCPRSVAPPFAASCLVRCCRTEVIVNGQGTPLFAGNLRLPETGARIVLSGAAAQRLAGNSHPARCARGWLLPGRFSRAVLSRSGRRHSLSFLLRTVAGAASDGRDLVCAIPGAFPPGAEQALISALPRGARRTFLVPQPVAVALDWIGAGDSSIEDGLDAEAFYAFLELDGERADFSVMQWTLASETSDRNGWLRFAAQVEGQSAIAPWPARAFDAACSRLALSVSFRQRAIALLQLNDAELIALAAGRRSDVAVWIQPESEAPIRLLITLGDVSEAMESWGKAVSVAAERHLGEWREAKMPAPLKLVIAGAATQIETFKYAWRDFPTEIVWRGEDAVTSGLRTFLSRIEKGLPTWRDYLPKLAILFSDTTGREDWKVLFDEKTSPQAGAGELLGREYEFSLAAGKALFALPLRRDDRRSSADPVLQLTESLAHPAKVKVRAAYRTGAGGLVLRIKSVEPGLVPETEMDWTAAGALAEAAAEPQAFSGDSTSLSADGFAREAAELRTILDAFFGDERELNGLARAVRELNKFLKIEVTTTERDSWREVAVNDVGALCTRLLYIKGLDGDTASDAFHQRVGSGAFRPPHGAVGNARRQRLAQNAGLQLAVLRAFSHLRSAAPFVFASWCLTRIDEPDCGNEERTACIRAIGLIAPASRPDQGLVERLLIETEHAHKASDTAILSIWLQALGLFLNSRESAVNLVPLERLGACADALRRLVEVFTTNTTASRTLWRHLLFALLSVRHGTRLEGGMEKLGPRSELARNVEATLRESSRQLAKNGRSREVEGIRFFEQKVGRSEVWQGKNALEQVAEVWRGKVVALLKQGGEEDE